MSYRVAFHWSETTAHPQGVVPAELTVPLRRHEVAMRGTLDEPLRCVALVGAPGGQARCGIHGTHPGVCREVAVGGDQCTRARLRHGLHALDANEVDAAYRSPDPPALPVSADLPLMPSTPIMVASAPPPTIGPAEAAAEPRNPDLH